MDINDLNSITQGMAAPEGGSWTPHIPGVFNGIIHFVQQKNIDFNGNGMMNLIWEFHIETSHGKHVHTIFDFTNEDFDKASHSDEHRTKIIQRVGSTKRMMHDIGICLPEETVGYGWTTSLEGIPGITDMFGKIRDTPCRVDIRMNDKDLKKRFSYINAPSNEPDYPQPIAQSAPQRSQQQYQPHSYQPPAQQSRQTHAQQYQNRQSSPDGRPTPPPLDNSSPF